MTNVMRYKGYSARIEYDDQDEIFFGKIAGIRDGIGFHAASVGDLKSAFHAAVDDYVETCAKAGKEPQRPFSGKVMFRIDPETHRLAGYFLNTLPMTIDIDPGWSCSELVAGTGREIASVLAHRSVPIATIVAGT